MRFEWFVARRYLRSPYRPAVLRLVTLFSVIGVAAGVATLVIALSMNTGFRETLQERLLGVTAHVSLTRPGSGGIRNYEEMAAKLAAISGVRSVTPAVYQTVLLSFAGQARGVVTKLPRVRIVSQRLDLLQLFLALLKLVTRLKLQREILSIRMHASIAARASLEQGTHHFPPPEAVECPRASHAPSSCPRTMRSPSPLSRIGRYQEENCVFWISFCYTPHSVPDGE